MPIQSTLSLADQAVQRSYSQSLRQELSAVTQKNINTSESLIMPTLHILGHLESVFLADTG